MIIRIPLGCMESSPPDHLYSMDILVMMMMMIMVVMLMMRMMKKTTTPKRIRTK